MESRFSPSVVEMLHKAGWFEGRKIPESAIVPGALRLFEKAKEVLMEFGGLQIGETGPGIDCAKSDVDLTPDVSDDMASQLKRIGAALGVELYHLGLVHHAHGHFIIDQLGRTYLFSQVSQEMTRRGDNFAETLEAFLLGKRLGSKEIIYRDHPFH